MSEFPIKVDAEVDASSTGKLVDAVIDIFSPATESLGLLGDCVRLARAEVAIQITRRAKQIALEHDLQLIAPPLKFLVPFFEKASLEDAEDSEATERWAQLLVGAAHSGPLSPHFVSILAEMDTNQARLLKSIYFGEQSVQMSTDPDFEALADIKPFDAIENILNLDAFDVFWAWLEANPDRQLDKLMTGAIKRFSGRGVNFHGIIMSAAGSSPRSPVIARRQSSVLERIDYEVLESLNLIRLMEFDRLGGPPQLKVQLHVQMDVYVITNLGIAFLSSVDGSARVDYSARVKAVRGR